MVNDIGSSEEFHIQMILMAPSAKRWNDLGQINLCQFLQQFVIYKLITIIHNHNLAVFCSKSLEKRDTEMACKINMIMSMPANDLIKDNT
jgi:hypothetical protein